MRPILTVTTEATDLMLLTDAEARQAIPNGAAADAAKVLQLRKAVSAAITSRCNVWASGAVPATLRLETLSQQNRLEYPVEQIRLLRRPVIEVVTVTEDDVTVDATGFELDPSTGLLRRLCNDFPSWWFACRKVVIAYRAGWASVPDNMRAAAMKFATIVWTEAGRDSGLKSIEIPNVITKEFWVGPADDPLFSREVEELLADYINPLQA